MSGMRLVVDVGGGHGASLIAILHAHPALHGVLFDLPQVVAGARAPLLAAGVAERCDTVEGDFFAAVPAGGDAYLLSAILHNWDDERALHILRNCRRVMAGHGTLLVAERIVPEGNTPSQAKLIDVIMLAQLGGQQRTEAEFRALYARAGFQLTHVVPTTPSGICVIEGVPVSATSQGKRGRTRVDPLSTSRWSGLAEQPPAADACQRLLRARFQARLSRSVRLHS